MASSGNIPQQYCYGCFNVFSSFFIKVSRPTPVCIFPLNWILKFA